MSKNSELYEVFQEKLEEVLQEIKDQKLERDDVTNNIYKGLKSFSPQTQEIDLNLGRLKQFIDNHKKSLCAGNLIGGNIAKFSVANKIAEILPALNRTAKSYDKRQEEREEDRKEYEQKLKEAVAQKVQEVTEEQQKKLDVAVKSVGEEKDNFYKEQLEVLQKKLQAVEQQGKDKVCELKEKVQAAEKQRDVATQAKQALEFKIGSLETEKQMGEKIKAAEITAAAAEASKEATVKATRESLAAFGTVAKDTSEQLGRLSLAFDTFKRESMVGVQSNSSHNEMFSRRSTASHTTKPKKKANPEDRKYIVKYFSEKKMEMIDYLVEHMSGLVGSDKSAAGKLLLKMLCEPFAATGTYFTGDIKTIENKEFKDKLVDLLATRVNTDAEHAAAATAIRAELKGSEPKNSVQRYVVIACFNKVNYFSSANIFRDTLSKKSKELKTQEVDFPAVDTSSTLKLN